MSPAGPGVPLPTPPPTPLPKSRRDSFGLSLFSVFLAMFFPPSRESSCSDIAADLCNRWARRNRSSVDRHGRALQAVCFRSEHDLAALLLGLHNHLRQSIKHFALAALVRFVATRIAVAYSDDFARPIDREGYFVLCDRHEAALRVHHTDRYHRDVFAVAIDRAAVRRELYAGRITGGFDALFSTRFATIEAARHQSARRIRHLPLEVRIAPHRLPAEARAIQQQLDLFAVAVHPHFNWRALSTTPIPVRQHVHHGLRRPPRLVIEKIVFGEAAGVHDSKVRTDTRPRVGRRLAAIIESGPHKSARDPRTHAIIRPPFFRAASVAGPVPVVGADVAPLFVIFINAARAKCAGLLATDARLREKILMKLIGIAILFVIKSLH